MPKQTKSSAAKVREICRQYQNEFGASPADDLRCHFCNVLDKYDEKFFVKSHRKSKLYWPRQAAPKVLLQKAQPISAVVERSSSMLKHVQRRAKNFDTKNAKKCMLVYCNI